MAPGLGGFKVQSSNLGCQALQSALEMRILGYCRVWGPAWCEGIKARAQNKNTS